MAQNHRIRPSKSYRVFIGGLPRETTLLDVGNFFHQFARRFDVTLKDGYGFIEFDDYRDAEKAVNELNGLEFLGRSINVEHAKGPRREDLRDRGRRQAWVEKYGPPQRTGYRIIVENLSSKILWQDLKDIMRRAGKVTYANAHTNRRNQGEVEFASRRDMENAIEKFDGYLLQGRTIKVFCDAHRRRSRSRSRGEKS